MAGPREAFCVWARPLVLQIILLSLCALSAALSSTPTSVCAQDVQQSALARSLFEEGVALADKSDWVSAADRFGRAYSLRPTSGIAFNWASVLIETGQLLHAQELLVSVVRDSAADAQLRGDSQVMLDSLSKRIAHLQVHLTGGLDAQTTLLVDSLPWPRAAWDIASPIDPGAHVVLVRSGDVERARSELTLGEGELRELSLEVVTEAPDLAAGQATTSPVDEPAKPPLYKSWILWAGVGTVVVAGVVTAVVLSQHKDARDAAPVTGNAMPGVLRW
jgi:hypothetical protein